MNEINRSEEEEKQPIERFFNIGFSKALVWTGLIILGVSIIFFFWCEFSNLSLSKEIDSGKISQFGDFIGGVVGALWSLAGLILIYLAFVTQSQSLENQQEATKLTLEAVDTQRKALEMQSKELELQRKELRETRKVFKEQAATMQHQRFENTFFSLIQLYHQIVNSINSEYFNVDVEKVGGKDVFEREYNSLRKQIKSNQRVFTEVYDEEWDRVQNNFGHYFRHLYRILKFVDETDTFDFSNEITHLKKYEYTSILRAQLSDHELLWLFYNCLSKNGKDKFKPLIEKYSLLKNLPQFQLADLNHREFYEKDAFEPLENEHYRRAKEKNTGKT